MKKLFPNGFKASGLAQGLKGILPSALDAVGILVPGASIVTNLVKKAVTKKDNFKPLPSVLQTTQSDGITEEGKNNPVTTVLVIGGVATIINALCAQYLGVSISVEVIKQILISIV